MPGDRRQNAADAREKLDEQLQRTEADLPQAGQDEGQSHGRSRGRDVDADECGFTAITDQQRSEVNDLFALIQGAGYMTAGKYNVQSDGQSTLITLQIIPPSSPGMPRDPSPPPEARDE